MFLTEGSAKDVIVAAVQATGGREGISDIIKETVDALIAADRKLCAYDKEPWAITSENLKLNHDKAQ